VVSQEDVHGFDHMRVYHWLATWPQKKVQTKNVRAAVLLFDAQPPWNAIDFPELRGPSPGRQICGRI
jgi:hypothetical protein